MKKMQDRVKKSPEQLKVRGQKVPLSTRVRAQTRESLEQAAKEADTTLSDLTAAILEDYAEWLEKFHQ
jgi:hypothetical protein